MTRSTQITLGMLFLTSSVGLTSAFFNFADFFDAHDSMMQNMRQCFAQSQQQFSNNYRQDDSEVKYSEDENGFTIYLTGIKQDEVFESNVNDDNNLLTVKSPTIELQLYSKKQHIELIITRVIKHIFEHEPINQQNTLSNPEEQKQEDNDQQSSSTGAEQKYYSRSLQSIQSTLSAPLNLEELTITKDVSNSTLTIKIPHAPTKKSGRAVPITVIDSSH